MRPARTTPRLRSTAPVLLALALLLAAVAAAASSATAAPTPGPAASTGGISSLGFSSVVLLGHVNPSGQATNYFFEYGHTRKYGSQSPLAPVGGGKTSV